MNVKRNIFFCLTFFFRTVAFDEQNLAVNLYIAGVVDNRGVTYRFMKSKTAALGVLLKDMVSPMISSNPTWKGFALYYDGSDINMDPAYFTTGKGKLSFPSVNNLLVLSFVPVDPKTNQKIAGPNLVVRLDLNNQIITVTVEDGIGTDMIIHSKETIYLMPLLFLIKQAFEKGQVRDKNGAVVNPSAFQMSGGAIGLYLVVTHDGEARIDGVEFSCSQPLRGNAYLYPTACSIAGTIDINSFRANCVKSVPYKMLKNYSGIRP